MNKNKENKKFKSTYEQFMNSLSHKEKKEYQREYKKLLLSEMLLAAMEEDDISVRALAKAAGVSPTVVQGIRSGANKNVTFKSFIKILNALGCSIIIKKGNTQFPLNLHHH
jgi:DNA-binding Xre family transcriptional regulator